MNNYSLKNTFFSGNNDKNFH